MIRSKWLGVFRQPTDFLEQATTGSNDRRIACTQVLTCTVDHGSHAFLQCLILGGKAMYACHAGGSLEITINQIFVVFVPQWPERERINLGMHKLLIADGFPVLF